MLKFTNNRNVFVEMGYWLVTLLLLTFFSSAHASVIAKTGNFQEELDAVEEQWANINYNYEDKDKEKAFANLAPAAEALTTRYPDRAEPLIWHGIVLSTWAGARGGLGALSLVKRAKRQLERSIEIDDKAMGGSAYITLGSLYYQVPGWPIGFGDNEKAQALLQKALELNPQGIESNFFYADFLRDQGQKKQAREYFEKARLAGVRPDHAVADRGRQKQIVEKLTDMLTLLDTPLMARW